MWDKIHWRKLTGFLPLISLLLIPKWLGWVWVPSICSVDRLLTLQECIKNSYLNWTWLNMCTLLNKTKCLFLHNSVLTKVVFARVEQSLWHTSVLCCTPARHIKNTNWMLKLFHFQNKKSAFGYISTQKAGILNEGISRELVPHKASISFQIISLIMCTNIPNQTSLRNVFSIILFT